MRINKSKIKEETELAVSEEFLVELDKELEKIIQKSEDRAKANGRRTLYGRDL